MRKAIISILILFILMPLFCDGVEFVNYNFQYYIEFEEPEYRRLYFSLSHSNPTPAKSVDLVMSGNQAANQIQYYIILESNQNTTLTLKLKPDLFRVYNSNNEIQSQYGAIAHTVSVFEPDGAIVKIRVDEDTVSGDATSLGSVKPNEETKQFIYSVAYSLDETSYLKASGGLDYQSVVTVECSAE